MLGLVTWPQKAGLGCSTRITRSAHNLRDRSCTWSLNADCPTASLLVNLLHLGCLIRSTLNLLERWQIIIITQTFIVIVNAQTKLDHAVDASCKLRRFIEVETGSEQRCIEEQPNQVLDSLVALVGGSLLLQFSHD